MLPSYKKAGDHAADQPSPPVADAPVLTEEEPARAPGCS